MPAYLALLLILLLLPLASCQQVDTAATIRQPSSIGTIRQPNPVSTTGFHPAKPATTAVPGCTVASEVLLSVSDEPGWQGYDWQKIWQQCPVSPVAGYNAVVALIRAGKTIEAQQLAAQAAGRFPDFSPLGVLDMRLNQPLQMAAKLADERYTTWLNSKSSHTFSRTPPEKESPSALPRLIKGEFEKRADFEARVAAAKEARKMELAGIEQRYQQAVADYNRAVERHNQLVRQESEERLARREKVRLELLNEAVAQVLGELHLSDLVYDAESERFTGRLRATGAGFAQTVSVPVPLANGRAERFKEEAPRLRPTLTYVSNSAGTAEQRLSVRNDGRDYPLEFAETLLVPAEISAVAEVRPEGLLALSPIREVQEQVTIEDEYYREALSIQDDPALAALRQQQAENERKLQLARAEQAREREKSRIEAEIRAQQQRLAVLGGTTGGEYEGLVEKYSWSFAPAAAPATDLVAVLIGNRNYGTDIPKVHYAYNDAGAMRTFLVDGLGVPPENIIVQRDATKGEMEGLFLRTLPNRVVRGRTDVLVYFSGHGMPKEREALLLPSDTRPEFADLTGYGRDRLLAELAALGARSTTVILDACFSGTAKDSAPLVAGKPVFAEVVPLAVPDGTVFISAARASEIARMDKEKGMSLMTFHLLQGLSGQADRDGDQRVTVSEIAAYLADQVPRGARLAFNAEQTPEVFGPPGHILVRYQ